MRTYRLTLVVVVAVLGCSIGLASSDQICGGIAGIPCESVNEFCKLPLGKCCCDFTGLCTEFPQACPQVCDPVCGCDGQTYLNECISDAAGVSVAHFGPCAEGGGLITGVGFESKEKLFWDPHEQAFAYNVYLEAIEAPPTFSAGICVRQGVTETAVAIDATPHPGVAWLFLIAGVFESGEGPLGLTPFCEPRTPAVPCLDAEALCKATGGIWDPLSCGHYFCGQFPDCDAIIPGCDCGSSANFFPGVGCQEDPACSTTP